LRDNRKRQSKIVSDTNDACAIKASYKQNDTTIAGAIDMIYEEIISYFLITLKIEPITPKDTNNQIK
jgi:hypothetical protein